MKKWQDLWEEEEEEEEGEEEGEEMGEETTATKETIHTEKMRKETAHHHHHHTKRSSATTVSVKDTHMLCVQTNLCVNYVG